jgi:HD-GYP domain-containing protein (c-di-GMP phosphodiesterase class II)
MQAKKRSNSGRKPGTGAAGAARRKPSARAKPAPRLLPAAPPIQKVIFSSIAKIAAERNIDRLMPMLADFGRDLIGADRCTVWLCNEKAGILWSRVAHGVDKLVMPKSKGIAGWVATHGEPLIINDPYHDDRFDQEFDRRNNYRTRAILTLPLRDAEGRVTGVYQAVNKKTGSAGFSEEDKEHLLLAATYTAEVLKTAQMQQEIEDTQRDVIFTMAEAGESRSKETGQHVKRVAEYCRLFGDKYGLSEVDTQTLKDSSPLHDIGKIAIPDRILQKEGPLTDAEREIMKKHAELGHYILQHSERRLLGSAAIIAWQHHERWDGKGYPCGLSGDTIHIYGRITALADVFDALASDRVYKKAWEMAQIVELFKAERGRQFDPDLADIFLDNLAAFEKILSDYRDVPEEGKPASPSCPDPG